MQRMCSSSRIKQQQQQKQLKNTHDDRGFSLWNEKKKEKPECQRYGERARMVFPL